MTAKAPVLTIDGPSGSGKGTISRGVAKRLGWHYLDSGAIYRAVGQAAAWEGVDVGDAEAVAACAARTQIRFETHGEGEPHVLVNGKDATRLLHTETAGAVASAIAAYPPVRAALVDLQLRFRQPPGLVADGRDMGTVVFPAAALKVFLTATPQERAMRRHKQLKEKGIDVSLPDLSWDIAQRDARDASRSVAPLRPAADARVIDSTSLTPEEVIASILKWLAAAGIERGRV